MSHHLLMQRISKNGVVDRSRKCRPYDESKKGRETSPRSGFVQQADQFGLPQSLRSFVSRLAEA
jgi:hypothetical protein